MDDGNAHRPRKRRTKKPERKPRTFGTPQEALVKALSHPLRIQALTILTERIAGPKEIAATLGMPEKVSNVSYHVRVLEDLGFVEVVKEEAVRGAVAHYYKAVEREIITSPEWSSLNPRVRNTFSTIVINTLVGDTSRSMKAGLLDRRGDRLFSRVILRLDESGWNKVRAIQTAALESTLKEQAAAERRLNGTEGGVLYAVLGQLLFEVPPEELDHTAL